MPPESARQRFSEFQLKMAAFQYAMTIISWDASTEAPKKSAAYRAKMIGKLAEDGYGVLYSPQTVELLEELLQADDLDPIERRSAETCLKYLTKMRNVPQELLVEQTEHTALAERVWEEAKATSDFALFAPLLEKSIELTKKVLEYRGAGGSNPYDMLLDDYEEGMNSIKYDAFFDALRRDLIPFVRDLHQNAAVIDDSLLTAFYPEADQKRFVEYLIKVLRYDLERGLMKVSVHPFTTGTHTNDVRFTVKYMENYLPASVFAGTHELGHAMHFQQLSPAFDGKLMLGGSQALAESQSRFYENFISRSLPFWQKHFAKLKEIFPAQLAAETPESFWRVVNRSKPSLIRIEADELTYALHIMLRYEIERDIFAGKVKVNELPELWNAKVKEYLGIVPPNDAEGVLQDVHWAGGMFGYFPTYALGTAYAAQFNNTLQKSLNVEQLILDDRMEDINAWLKENIHQHGSFYPAEELLQRVTGEAFNPAHLVNFLKEKYSKVYKL